MGKILLGMAKNPVSLQHAILFFMSMSVVFSLLYWMPFLLFEGTPAQTCVGRTEENGKVLRVR
jgi:hypothetical protein